MGDYELFHAERAKHKYIKKIGKRYFYTQEQLKAFLSEKGSDVSEKAKELKTAASNSINTAKTAATQKTQTVQKATSKPTVANAIKKKERKVRRKVGKAVVSNLAKRSVKSMKKKASKGKESVSKFMKHRLTTGGVTVTYAEAEIKK